jgi:hypothetical protein
MSSQPRVEAPLAAVTDGNHLEKDSTNFAQHKKSTVNNAFFLQQCC